jgi:SNF2 family DNA or RNA helicase
MFSTLRFEEGIRTELKIGVDMIDQKGRIVGKMKVPVAFTKKGAKLWASYGFNKQITAELKAMEQVKWHGYDEPNPIKQWSLADSQHNRFQLEYLTGGNPYAHYDKAIESLTPRRKECRQHQIDIAAFELTRHYCTIAAEMGTGKTLATIEAMEASEARQWFWIAPKSAMYSVQLEFDKWSAIVRPMFYTYEGLTKLLKDWPKDQPPPQGLVLDEASRCKTHTAQRTQAAKYLADQIRDHWGERGFVILMSGTPAPKSPVDWWSLCNIACPGFLKEGDPQKFRKRLAIMKEAEGVAGVYSKLESWLDDEKKCAICGKFTDDTIHDEVNVCEEDYHTYKPSKNEVSYLYKRMNGLVLVKLKKDVLDLPEKQYKVIRVKPTQAIINAAKLITATGSSAIKTLTLLRELSDGFQYDETAIGTEKCPLCKGDRTVIDFMYTGPDDQYDEIMRRQYAGLEIPKGSFQETQKACPNCDGTGESTAYTRTATQVECAKEVVLADLLDEHEDVGRLVIYAGFTGSVDRCVEIAKKEKWEYIRVDGRGWTGSIPGTAKELLLQFQGKEIPRLVFIGQPSAAGMGLTLHASPTIVFYSNDFNAESRSQAEDRIHRMGMDVNRGATIIDIFHLPSDELVFNNLKKKKKLQAMTMGEMNNQLASLEQVERSQ